MTEATPVRVDAKGRVQLPLALRRRLGIEAGSVIYVQEDGAELRVRKGENPFDVLAERALADARAGKTKSLRAYAAEHGIAFNDE
jgi:bifunctional DNA-binding transcriptional regulator/antitoxin component of YhaV-PrlF toxin-antitoxin module